MAPGGLGALILVDSNILIDLLSSDPHWYDWSARTLAEAGQADILAINFVILAEVAPRYETLDQFMAIMDDIGIKIAEYPDSAAFMAGKIFQSYRARRIKSGTDTSKVLPDFLIGGHAQASGASILTRDARFYRTYFPAVPLITPLKEDHD